MRACVDIGGTKLAVSLAENGSRQLLHRRAEPTEKRGAPDAVARQVLRLLGDVCAEAGMAPDAIGGVGVSSCGPFVMRRGCIEVSTPNICGGLAGADQGLPNDWTAFPLEAPLRAHFGASVPVRVENDCVAALEAERRWGALQGVDDCAYVTWSTGIGMGLCVGGRVLRGKNGNAGHGGHTFASGPAEGPICGCGNVGDLESLVSGTAMTRRFAAQGFHDAAGLLEAAKAGNAQAGAIVDELCRILGRGLFNVVALLDLQAVSLGGSVFWHHRDHLLPRLQAEVAAHLPALTRGVELRPAGLRDTVGDYAALALLD